jgi:hypothetical protein
MRIRARCSVGIMASTAFATVVWTSVAAQPPAGAPGQPAAPGQGRGRGGGFRQPDPIDFQEHDGWTSLFDGSTLKGWSGDSNWKVEDGATRSNRRAKNRRARCISCGKAAKHRTSS